MSLKTPRDVIISSIKSKDYGLIEEIMIDDDDATSRFVIEIAFEIYQDSLDNDLFELISRFTEDVKEEKWLKDIFISAIMFDNLRHVRVFIEKFGFDVNGSVSLHYSLSTLKPFFYVACSYKSLDVAKYLYENGADPTKVEVDIDKSSSATRSPIELVFRDIDKDVIKFLSELKEVCIADDIDTNNYMFFSSFCDVVERVKLLRKYGGKYTFSDDDIKAAKYVLSTNEEK